MELQKVFQEVNRKLAYNIQHLSKKSSNVSCVLFFGVCGCVCRVFCAMYALVFLCLL